MPTYETESSLRQPSFFVLESIEEFLVVGFGELA